MFTTYLHTIRKPLVHRCGDWPALRNISQILNFSSFQTRFLTSHIFSVSNTFLTSHIFSISNTFFSHFWQFPHFLHFPSFLQFQHSPSDSANYWGFYSQLFPVNQGIQSNCVQYSTVQYNRVQYSTVQYNKVQYSTIQYSITLYSTLQCSIVKYNRVQ